jgi:hypothetical protein
VGVSPSGKALDFESDIRWFESSYPYSSNHGLVNMRDGLRPFWRYYGGKYRLAPYYPEPTSRTVVEPFAGGAGYSLLHYKQDIILNDASPIISAIWDFLIHAEPDDVRGIPDIPEGGTTDDLDVPHGARYLAGFWCGDAAVSPGKSPAKWARENNSYAMLRERAARQVPKIKHWRITSTPYSEVEDIEATWFIDPPYQNKAGSYYPEQPDSFDALGAWCKTRRGQVIVCEQSGATWMEFKPFKLARSAPGHFRPATSEEVWWYREDVPWSWP